MNTITSTSQEQDLARGERLDGGAGNSAVVFPPDPLPAKLVEIARCPTFSSPNRVFLCDVCDEYKLLDRYTNACPECNSELEEVACSECDTWATRIDEFTVCGAVPRLGSETVLEPRCPRH